tara:strand:+ start:2162 stop:2398 length:237 start_codon:yes stop_codon:yes gene_type:complete
MQKIAHNEIKITWIEDEYDCDDCGTSYASGAIVDIDDKPLLVLRPSAHCFADTHYTEGEVYKKILEKLKFTVNEEHEY